MERMFVLLKKTVGKESNWKNGRKERFSSLSKYQGNDSSNTTNKLEKAGKSKNLFKYDDDSKE